MAVAALNRRKSACRLILKTDVAGVASTGKAVADARVSVLVSPLLGLDLDLALAPALAPIPSHLLLQQIAPPARR